MEMLSIIIEEFGRMASIKDAFEESYQDNLAFLKFIIFAIPVYYCVHLYTTAVKVI